ncbi:ketol-acid reductoisomerase [Helicobacter ailurogastricus]|uniref:Ketol-acid reductoisomerase (NADP(+)) n=1 Tax=Helicobacter ailurogastricus TaxID=1578720 RepID=A0A0K2X6U1_9HELI|nr:ketol-acid reductoisomerase [Helicobacter ailurogastricus]CRF41756.1 Ketol-acid reductoisomerase [Helicobacter ailurogastricus]CRF42098.1 Ketol-acid reductoisomerase [Helicobacter ailurogastricus]CRF44167.1 Ketol-acid reductoisomerase [Helicobacter ailurogastricus]CRF52933.1 Ketol-acid reductoisomerase [Helicobacter ailurogastricus]BDQ28396.1 ketol-acid reductoisomerase (NADP(+)) [Helicobacter ailurogastricus]
MGSLPIYTDKKGNLETLLSQKVAILGYGAHGRAHALNLRDSGVAVQIGLYAGSPSAAVAQKDGFGVFSLKQCVQDCAVLALLLPDEIHGDIYKQEIAPHIKPGQTLIFAHGFSVCFGQVSAPEGVGLVLVSPKSTGYALRENYKEGRGVFALMGVEQDNSHKNAKEIALSYACALGCGRVGILETTFKDETHCDLFGEQAVLCGGVESLLTHAFNTLVEAGYPKEVAYFECVQELKVIADLIYTKGLVGMLEHISNTAEYGGLESGDEIIDPAIKERMQGVLNKIQDGSFARRFLEEKEQGYPKIHQNRQAVRARLLEQTGAHLRQYLFR